MPAPKPRNIYERTAVQVYKKPGQSLTEQHHARSCDINTIMAKYIKTGIIEHVNNYEPTFGDVSGLDFKKAMDTVALVKSEFANMPAYVRDHFNQDEAAYLEKVSTPEGVQELKNILYPADAYTDDGSPDLDAITAARAESEIDTSTPEETSETVTESVT